MKSYQVPTTEEIKVEHLMNDTPGGHSGGDVPTNTTAPQRLHNQFS